MSTKIYGVKGEDGRRLSRPLLRLAARKYGWGELPELEYSGRGKPIIPGEGRWLSLSHSGATPCAPCRSFLWGWTLSW